MTAAKAPTVEALESAMHAIAYRWAHAPVGVQKEAAHAELGRAVFALIAAAVAQGRAEAFDEALDEAIRLPTSGEAQAERGLTDFDLVEERLTKLAAKARS